MTNVIATASGGSSGSFGVFNERSSVTIRNSIMKGSTGLTCTGTYDCNVKVSNSAIEGSANSIYNYTGTTRVAGSELAGGPVSNPAPTWDPTHPGTVSYAGVHDENYTFYAGPACP